MSPIKQKPSVRKAFRVPTYVLGHSHRYNTSKLIKINGELLEISHTMDVGIKEYTLVTYTVPEFEFKELEENEY